jgi:hypothetical protein
MDLKDFITQTLVQIAEGVSASEERITQLGGQVNPYISSDHKEMGKHGILWASGLAVHIIEFDVALTANSGTGTKGGIGIFSGAVNLGSSGESRSESSSVSRVRFTVPLTLPRPKA